jgi:hypothetical protein
VKTTRILLLSTLVLALATQAFAGAKINIVNNNAAGVGFNDPTPAIPVGGNDGVTLGEQRLNAFKFAASVWGATLDDAAEINILAAFVPQSCTATAATLGSAGATQIFRDFTGAPLAQTWYSVALTGKLVGFDPSPGVADINANFNVNIGKTGCLETSGWYLGLDGNHPANRIDLVTVLLHEFAHGFGFQQFASVTSGALFSGFPDAYNRHLTDDTTGKTWDLMTNAERVASAINFRKVSWNGPHVNAAVPDVLAAGTQTVRVNSPSPAAGLYPIIGVALFGATVGSPNVSGDLAYADVPQACTVPTNVAGKIAIIDRGTCSFAPKALNAQLGGAIAVLIVNNVAGSVGTNLAQSSPETPGITVPVVLITQEDGTILKAAVAGGTTNGFLGIDLSVQAGADLAGRALLYTPKPVVSGSTISHWDTVAFPNQLMEPNINGDLTHNVKPPSDLTLPLLRDIGWYPDADLDLVSDEVDACLGSDLKPTVVIGGIDTLAPNTFFTNGCSVSDLVRKCQDGAPNHGQGQSCVADLAKALYDAGFLTPKQQGAVKSAAARN